MTTAAADEVSCWVAARTPTPLRHADVAACGRPSREVLDAQAAHTHREAALGGYVAQERAEPQIEELRAGLGALVGRNADDVALTHSAGDAFARLLDAWPLGRGARVGMLPSEYGPNAQALRRAAADRGWQLVVLPVDGAGRLAEVPSGLDLVTFPQVASQRGLVQPLGPVLAAGTPLLLDVAQSLGQTPVPAGCAAYVGTSRKWLCGPRGVGFAVLDPALQELLRPAPTAVAASGPGARRWDSPECHVAGRVGLAVALEQWTPALVPLVQRRARELRAALTGLAGWHVVEPEDEPTGITTLSGGDPGPLRAALLAEGVLCSAVPAERADELTGPVLRLSTAPWLDATDVQAVAAAVHRRTG